MLTTNNENYKLLSVFMIRILLLGAGSSASINFIKALRLSKEKIYIVGADPNRYYLEMSPVDKRYLVTKEKGESEYINQLNEIIARENLEFTHAQPDPEVKILSDHRLFIKNKTFLPSKKAIDIFQDKLLTYQHLSKKKVPVANTTVVGNENKLREIFWSKDKTIWLRARKGAGGKASLPTKKFEHAKMWIEYWIERGLKWEDFLAHEYLPGKEVSWLSIWKDGKLICSQGKERVEWVQANISPSGVAGTTAIQKTVHYGNVNEIGVKTVLAVENKPNGIFVVDTKENSSGIPCVTEVNPGRFFTTSLFYATLGVNMPLIFVKLGLDLPIGKVAQHNSTEKNVYWIRVTDGGPTMVKEGRWSSKIL